MSRRLSAYPNSTDLNIVSALPPANTESVADPTLDTSQEDESHNFYIGRILAESSAVKKELSQVIDESLLITYADQLILPLMRRHGYSHRVSAESTHRRFIQKEESTRYIRTVLTAKNPHIYSPVSSKQQMLTVALQFNAGFSFFPDECMSLGLLTGRKYFARRNGSFIMRVAECQTEKEANDIAQILGDYSLLGCHVRFYRSKVASVLKKSDHY